MTSERTPDAVRSPLRHAGAGDSSARLANLQTEFSRVLKVLKVFVRHQGTEHFVSGRPDDTINFPSHDTRAGWPRYDWEDRGDGVLFGYLKPEA
jgi:hypothetical protein